MTSCLPPWKMEPFKRGVCSNIKETLFFPLRDSMGRKLGGVGKEMKWYIVDSPESVAFTSNYIVHILLS